MTPENIEQLNELKQPAIEGVGRSVRKAQAAAICVQFLAVVLAISGIIFGLFLMGNEEKENPNLGPGIAVVVNALVFPIIIYALGAYMEARLKQGSDTSRK